jgi:N-acetylglucosaminyl-diphospho-decaprenol L-rhamnosyltransferase
MSIDILVCNYNTQHLIEPMLDALHQSKNAPPIRVLMIDNASRDGSADYVRKQHPEVLLIESAKNVGFGRANNLLLPLVRAPYVLLLNTDAFVSPDCLRLSHEYMQTHPECGILGVKLLSRDGSLQPSCRYFPTPLNIFLAKTGLQKYAPWIQPIDDLGWAHDQNRECDWVPGCYYLVRREVIEQVGLFDHDFFLYYEEVDHCKRAKNAGWQVHYFAGAATIHIGGESAKSEGSVENAGRQLSSLQIESEIIYLRKHHGVTGLLAHLLLTATHEALSEIKSSIKVFVGGAPKSRTRQLKETWRFCQLTQWGKAPTR